MLNDLLKRYNIWRPVFLPLSRLLNHRPNALQIMPTFFCFDPKRMTKREMFFPRKNPPYFKVCTLERKDRVSQVRAKEFRKVQADSQQVRERQLGPKMHFENLNFAFLMRAINPGKPWIVAQQACNPKVWSYALLQSKKWS